MDITKMFIMDIILLIITFIAVVIMDKCHERKTKRMLDEFYLTFNNTSKKEYNNEFELVSMFFPTMISITDIINRQERFKTLISKDFSSLTELLTRINCIDNKDEFKELVFEINALLSNIKQNTNQKLNHLIGSEQELCIKSYDILEKIADIWTKELYKLKFKEELYHD